MSAAVESVDVVLLPPSHSSLMGARGTADEGGSCEPPRWSSSAAGPGGSERRPIWPFQTSCSVLALTAPSAPSAPAAPRACLSQPVGSRQRSSPDSASEKLLWERREIHLGSRVEIREGMFALIYAACSLYLNFSQFQKEVLETCRVCQYAAEPWR